MNAKPISEKKPMSTTGRVLVFIIGVVLVLIGFAIVWWVTIAPLLNVFRSSNWPTTPCTITSSQLERHDSDDGDSWSAEISFSYSVDNRSYTSSTWSFFDVSGSRSRAKAVVDQYPSGKKANCYYDPDDPTTAVLSRKFDWISLMGILFLLFSAFGAGAIYYAVAGANKKTKPARQAISGRSSLTGQPTSNVFSSEWDGPQRLKPESTRGGRLIGIAVFGLLWNGFVGVFIYFMWSANGNMAGPDICFTLFMIPFVLVGLALIGGFFHQLLALTNPNVEIALSSGAVTPGESLDIAWEMTGNSSRIRKFLITIEGREQVRYTRGTNTYTDKEVFCTIEVANTGDQAEMEFGEYSVDIPIGTVHSLDAPNNKIIWSINVRGDIPMWPDVTEDFEFRVKPQ